jgi:hypothetical protein
MNNYITIVHIFLQVLCSVTLLIQHFKNEKDFYGNGGFPSKCKVSFLEVMAKTCILLDEL